jgi:hypothetical protein
MAGAAAREEEGGGVQEEQNLTGNPPVVVDWPEMGQRRRIWHRRSSVSGEVSVTVATIRGTSGQFLERGGRGRRWGYSQHVGGAGGGTGQRR